MMAFIVYSDCYYRSSFHHHHHLRYHNYNRHHHCYSITAVNFIIIIMSADIFSNSLIIICIYTSCFLISDYLNMIDEVQHQICPESPSSTFP